MVSVLVVSALIVFVVLVLSGVVPGCGVEQLTKVIARPSKANSFFMTDKFMLENFTQSLLKQILIHFIIQFGIYMH